MGVLALKGQKFRGHVTVATPISGCSKIFSSWC